jgi:RND family efflux transporter MFP subunit
MKSDQIRRLAIPPGAKKRRAGVATFIFVTVAVLVAVAAVVAWPRKTEVRTFGAAASPPAPAGAASPAPAAPAPAAPARAAAGSGSLLTMSGYIINRERIEISPRFVSVVKWIGVKRGDAVKRGDVLVLLDDTEQKARLLEAEGAVARAEAALGIARKRFERAKAVKDRGVQSIQEYDDAQSEVRLGEAAVKQAEGQRAVAATYLDWTVIRSPIDGVVLEKLADENELVTPQSFGGERSPSTALVSLADPKDLQVELDVNETDLPKIALGQRCKVSPEAYPERSYDGYVAEISPEASRQKGTLQIKVQIAAPDLFLVPELSAKVDFLGAGDAGG